MEEEEDEAVENGWHCCLVDLVCLLRKLSREPEGQADEDDRTRTCWATFKHLLLTTARLRKQPPWSL